MATRFLNKLFISMALLVILEPAWLQSANPEQAQVNVEPKGEPVIINISVNSPTRECCEGHRVKNVPQGYVNLPGYGYYKYHSEHKKFNEARKICKEEGGHLVIYNSETEAKFVASLPDNKYDWAFIGMHDLYEEGQWVTVLDEEVPATGYNKWHQGEPNLGTKENCGVTFPNGLLGDYECGIARSFFCEIN